MNFFSNPFVVTDLANAPEPKLPARTPHKLPGRRLSLVELRVELSKLWDDR